MNALGRSPRLPVQLDVTIATRGWPKRPELVKLAKTALAAACAETGFSPRRPPELSLAFSDDASVRLLNARWRGKDQPTNVLSFPATVWAGKGEPPPLLGDVVLALETVVSEAGEQGKSLDHHLTHLIVHGFLHLLGYDHVDDDEAETMEAIERRALDRLAIADPYALSPDHG